MFSNNKLCDNVIGTIHTYIFFLHLKNTLLYLPQIVQTVRHIGTFYIFIVI